MGRMCRRSFIPTASSIGSLGYEPTASRPACAQCNKATVMERGEGSPDAAPRSRRHTLPSDLTRRFEAVVLWSSTPALSSRTAQRMTALSEAGAPVGWLAPGRIDTLVAQLDPPSSGAAPLILADSGGTGGAIVDRAGSSRFGEPQRFDLRVLDRAGAALVQALEPRGLAAKTLPRPVSSIRVKIELADQTSRTPSEFQRFLLAHGIPGVPHLADLARQSAREAGVGDPRVVVDGSRVEIALEDAGDVALSMVDALWRTRSRPPRPTRDHRWFVGRAPPPRARDRPRRSSGHGCTGQWRPRGPAVRNDRTVRRLGPLTPATRRPAAPQAMGGTTRFPHAGRLVLGHQWSRCRNPTRSRGASQLVRWPGRHERGLPYRRAESSPLGGRRRLRRERCGYPSLDGPRRLSNLAYRVRIHPGDECSICGRGRSSKQRKLIHRISRACVSCPLPGRPLQSCEPGFRTSIEPVQRSCPRG